MRWLLRLLDRALNQRDPVRIAARVRAEADARHAAEQAERDERSRENARNAWALRELDRDLKAAWACDGDVQALLGGQRRIPGQRDGSGS